MTEEESKGVTYIDTSPKHDGFKRLFKNVKNEIFEPALKYLPTEEEIRFRMLMGLKEAELARKRKAKP